MKRCTKCNGLKDLDQFRIRTDKRPGKECTYHNYQCRECERRYTKKWYYTTGQQPEYIEKNRERSKIASKKTSKARWQRNKNDPKWMAMVAKWREDNKDRVIELQKKRSNKWNKFHMSALTDNYIKLRVKQKSGLEYEDIPQSLIEAERIRLQVIREINK